MKNSFQTLFLLLFTISSYGQLKYPSLLWEIKKDNERPSYLYGTMHVNERIAFHLSDVFFEKLISTDKIALESNPEIWMDEMQKSPELSLMGNGFGTGLFYTNFLLEPLQTVHIKESFLFNKMMLNGILYRTYDQMSDYQEDTYLDMFIYQTGKRTNREIVSLEDFEESRDLVNKAMKSNRNFDPPAWAKKLLMEKPLNVLLENAYRDKNLDMIDSISIGTNSPKYNEYMLFQRNDNMVHRMDSIFQKGQTLFIGIGAAHLPGPNGVIEKLREKGYQVSPILGEYTQKGKAEKERLDHAFQFSNYTKSSTSDQIISVNSASKFYEFDFGGLGISLSPDLKNGSFVNIIRLKKFDFLRKDNHRSGISKIDSLLFENIPGRIIKKEQTKINGFDVLDVTNKTKDGDHQRYWFISTPIEYLLVSMIGKYEFVDVNSQSIRNSLQIKPMDSQWVKTSPIRGGYEVMMPAYHTISTNDPTIVWANNPQIYGYDATDDSHYFVMEKSLNDVDYLEDTEFELKRIHYEFYRKLKIDSLNGNLDKSKNSFTSKGNLNDEKTIRLKSVIKGSHYYLLGSTGNSSQTNKFFDSFQLNEFHYLNEPIVHQDTTLNMSVRTQFKPVSNPYEYEAYAYGYGDPSDKNHFEGINKSRDFHSDSRQNITVNYRTFDRYESYEKIDSLWNEIIKNNDEMYDFELESKKISTTAQGDHRMDAYFKKKDSEQKVKAAYITNGNYYYSLKTLVPLNYQGNDSFIEEFFSSIKPNASETQTSIFENKMNLFLEDLNSSEDSIRSSALKSIYQIKFKNEDLPTLVNLLENHEFSEEEETYKNQLFKKIANLNHPKAKEFLTNFYHKNTDDSNVQIAVIESMASKDSEEDYTTMMALLKDDLPLPSSPMMVSSFFTQLKLNQKKSAKILPDLMNFKSIPEYQNQIISLAAELVDSGAIQPTKLKSHRKDLLTLGKLELKRSYSAWKASNQEYGFDNEIDRLMHSVTYNSNSEYGSPFTMLKNYLVLLQPFSTDKEIKEFLQKVDQLEVPELMLYSLEQKLKNKDEIPTNLLKILLNEDKNALAIYKIHKEEDRLKDLPKEINHTQVAKSIVINGLYNFDEKKDSLEFLTKRKVSYKDKSFEVFFFKYKFKNQYTMMDVTEIHSVGIEIDEDSSLKVVLESIHSNDPTEYIDEESLEKTILNDLDKVLFGEKKRASFVDRYNLPMSMY